MSYKIVSLKCDESKNDWVSSVCAEAALNVKGKRKPVYLEACWNGEVADEIQCEITRNSIHNLMIFAEEGDTDALRKGGKMFKSYEKACESEYGEVYYLLGHMINAILKGYGYDFSHKEDEEDEEGFEWVSYEEMLKRKEEKKKKGSKK